MSPLHMSKRSREMADFLSLETLRQDVRFGLRTLRRSPGFTAVAVLTLALGIGANAAIFSVVKAVLLDPLPYAHADRLVIIGEPLADDPDNPVVPYTVMREVAARSQSLESVSAYGDGPATLVENDRPEKLRGLSVDSNFFDTVGAQVELGRNFLPSDQPPNQRLAIILSHSLWVRRFGGDPHILGRVAPPHQRSGDSGGRFCRPRFSPSSKPRPHRSPKCTTRSGSIRLRPAATASNCASSAG